MVDRIYPFISDLVILQLLVYGNYLLLLLPFNHGYDVAMIRSSV